MQEILMIRHGQASFGAEDYDNLSALGRQQSFWLGAHLQQLGFAPHIAIKGGLKRHAQTLDEMAKSLVLPTQHTDGAFVEINLTAIVEGYQNKYNDLPDYEAEPALFNTAMRMVLTAWIEGRFVAEEICWADYARRVTQGLDDLRAHGKSVLLVTSGGTITAAIGAMLRLDAAAQVAMMLKIHNSSVTKLMRTNTGLELHSLNNVGHLETADRKGALTYV